MCTQCACNLTCSKTAIERHSKSAAHIRLQKSSQQQCSISDSFQKLQQPAAYRMLTESRICAFIAQNNLPFTISKPLVNLIKETCPSNTSEKESLKQLKMCATKCTNVMRQGLGYKFSRDLVDRLKHTKFSIIPDETTDVGSEKQLAICVVYFDQDTFEVVTAFLDMVIVQKCDAETLYSAIKQCFQEKNIPLENIIGYSSDTCNECHVWRKAECSSSNESRVSSYHICEMQLSHDPSLCLTCFLHHWKIYGEMFFFTF